MVKTKGEKAEKVKMKRIKTNTVLVSRPRAGKYGIPKLVPLICFSGQCLSDYGFEVGKRYEVYAQKDRLVLKAKEFKYKNPIIKKIKKEV
jgi:hypothetical protein